MIFLKHSVSWSVLPMFSFMHSIVSGLMPMPLVYLKVTFVECKHVQNCLTLLLVPDSFSYLIRLYFLPTIYWIWYPTLYFTVFRAPGCRRYNDSIWNPWRDNLSICSGVSPLWNPTWLGKTEAILEYGLTSLCQCLAEKQL